MPFMLSLKCISVFEHLMHENIAPYMFTQPYDSVHAHALSLMQGLAQACRHLGALTFGMRLDS